MRYNRSGCTPSALKFSFAHLSFCNLQSLRGACPQGGHEVTRRSRQRLRLCASAPFAPYLPTSGRSETDHQTQGNQLSFYQKALHMIHYRNRNCGIIGKKTSCVLPVGKNSVFGISCSGRSIASSVGRSCRCRMALKGNL